MATKVVAGLASGAQNAQPRTFGTRPKSRTARRTSTGSWFARYAAVVIQPLFGCTSPIWRCARFGITRPSASKRTLICFIAYALGKTLQQRQARAGLGHSPRTILEEFSCITAADIVLPLVDCIKTRTAHSVASCVPSASNRSFSIISDYNSLNDSSHLPHLKCSGDLRG